MIRIEPIEKLREAVKEIEKMKQEYEFKIKQLRDEIRQREIVIKQFRGAVRSIKDIEEQD